MRRDVEERLAVRVDLSRLDLALELRLVAAHRSHLLLELVGDVDDEAGSDEILPVRQGVKDLERPMLRHIGRELGETGEEARVTDELCRHPVIGVPPLKGRRDDDARTVAPDGSHEGHTRARCVLDRGVG